MFVVVKNLQVSFTLKVKIVAMLYCVYALACAQHKIIRKSSTYPCQCNT